MVSGPLLRWFISDGPRRSVDHPILGVGIDSRNVMDPFEARGFSLDYGEQDVRLNGESSYANYETRERAEEERSKAIEYRKNQSGNIYSFEMVFSGTPKGEETSKPKLIYRDKESASYEK